MRVLQLLTAGFLLAAAMFLIVMLTAPPTSEAADTESGAPIAPTALVLVGP
jgi:hypothetical protein